MTQSQCNAVLVLSDGRYFFGRSIGSEKDHVGEVCFTTGATGYQHTITDPSFAGQIITFAFPHIGNVGINQYDSECEHILAKGIVVRELSRASHVSSYMDLNSWMKQHHVSGISDIDTRALVSHLRLHGSQNGVIHHFSDASSVDIPVLREMAMNTTVDNLATQTPKSQDYMLAPQGLHRVCVIDFGVKKSIITALLTLNCEVHVIAAKDNFITRALALRPRGVVLSSGPGDPAELPSHFFKQIRVLLKSEVPTLGICLGHQVLSLSLGAKTIKMHHGHRGINHPVYNIQKDSVEITSQNHGFTVDAQTLPSNAEITHVSLFDRTVEGIRLNDRPVFSVQYHPEGSPGPYDSHYVFKDFVDLMLATPDVKM